MLSRHPAKFGCRRHCGSGEKLLLVCHVIFQQHVDERSHEFQASQQPAKFAGVKHLK